MAARASVIAGLIAAAALAACARDPIVSTSNTISAGNWQVERQTDRVTGKPVASAFVMTRNGSHTGEAFTKPAGLSIGCFKDLPLVKFAFEFKIGTTLNAELGYRFDDRPGHEIEARVLADHSVIVIEPPEDVRPFLAELATSKVLYVRIRSLNSGRTAAEFQVDGGEEAMAAALASCPLPPPAPPAPAPKRRR
jgi:hypothetical protein